MRVPRGVIRQSWSEGAPSLRHRLHRITGRLLRLTVSGAYEITHEVRLDQAFESPSIVPAKSAPGLVVGRRCHDRIEINR